METRRVSGVLMKRPLLLIGLVICAGTFISCDEFLEDNEMFSLPSAAPSPSPGLCEIEPDYSSTETTLRTTIFAADTEGAAEILSRDETFAQGEGLRYLPEQACAVVRTENVRCDPDIVAARAIALSVKSFADADRLANAIVISFEPECECSLFNSTVRDQMKAAFREVLADPEEREAILAFGGPANDTNTECPSRFVPLSPDPQEIMTGSGRRLLQGDGKVATTALPCALCDPPNLCDHKHVYCPRGSETG